MTTKADTRELSQAQLTAIDLLVAGSTVTAAAEAVGVARQTASEWLNRDTDFQAALNVRRAEVFNGCADKLRGMLPKALDVLEAFLEASAPQDKLRAALGVVRMANLKLSDTGKTGKGELELDALLHEM